MSTYKKQDHEQFNDWGRAESINKIIDNIDAIVGSDTLKETVNSCSTRIDKVSNTLDFKLKEVDDTLQDSQVSIQKITTDFAAQVSTLKDDTQNTVNNMIKNFDIVKDTTGDKANLYKYFDNPDTQQRRNLVQTANKLLEMVGYNSTNNTSIEDINTQIKDDSLVKTLNKVDGFLGTVSSLTTTEKSNLTGAINELDKDVGNVSSLTTTAKDNVVGAINELDSDVGNKASLTTQNKTDLVSAVNELDKEIGDINTIEEQVKQTDIVGALNKINTLIGTLTQLTTIAKTSLVLAINELDKELGTLTNLSTSAKDNIVSAINELKTNFTTLDGEAIKSATLDGTDVTKTANKLEITLPKASTDVLGAIKLGDGLKYEDEKVNVDRAIQTATENAKYIQNQLVIDKDGNLCKVKEAITKYTESDSSKLEKIMPVATQNTLGGVKIGSGITINNDTISVTKDSISLDKVNNTADTEKPVSTAVTNELNKKANDSEVVKKTDIETTTSENTDKVPSSKLLKDELSKKQNSLTANGGIKLDTATNTISADITTTLIESDTQMPSSKAVKTKIDSIETNIGTVSSLFTDKKTIVEAINELKTTIDGLKTTT